MRLKLPDKLVVVWIPPAAQAVGAMHCICNASALARFAPTETAKTNAPNAKRIFFTEAAFQSKFAVYIAVRIPYRPEEAVAAKLLKIRLDPREIRGKAIGSLLYM